MKAMVIILINASGAEALQKEQVQTALNAQLPAEKKYFTDMEKDFLAAKLCFKADQQGKQAALNVIRDLLAEVLARQEYTKAAYLRELRKEYAETKHAEAS